MRVVRQHLGGDMSSNRHDRIVASLGLRELSDGMVPQIVEPKTGQGTSNLVDVRRTFLVGTALAGVLLDAACGAGDEPRQVPPCRPPARLWPCRIEVRCFASGEYVMVRSDLSERLCAPV